MKEHDKKQGNRTNAEVNRNTESNSKVRDDSSSVEFGGNAKRSDLLNENVDRNKGDLGDNRYKSGPGRSGGERDAPSDIDRSKR